MLTKDILVLKIQILKKYTTTIDNLCTHKCASMKKKINQKNLYLTLPHKQWRYDQGCMGRTQTKV